MKPALRLLTVSLAVGLSLEAAALSSFEKVDIQDRLGEQFIEFRRLYEKRRYDSAIDGLEAVVTQKTLCPELFYNLGLVYYTRDEGFDCVMARDYYTYFLKTAPDSHLAPYIATRLEGLREKADALVKDRSLYRSLAERVLREAAERRLGAISARAVRALAQRRSPEIVAQLKEEFVGESKQTPFAVLEILSDAGDSQATPMLIDVAKNPSMSERVQAVRLLSRTPRDAAVADALNDLSIDSDKTVRVTAGEILLAQGDRGVVSILEAILADLPPFQGCGIAAILARHNSDEGTQYLERCTKDQSPAVRVAAAAFLASMGRDEYRSVLREFADKAPGRRGDVNYLAQVALWRMNDAETVSAFEKRLAEGSRLDAQTIIDVMCRFPNPAQKDLLNASFDRAGGGRKMRVAATLAVMGDDRRLDFLAQQLIADHWTTRIDAASAILYYYDLGG